MEEIRNRVKESGIITLDLANHKPKVAIEEIDLSLQLWEGLVLKEKDFRKWVAEHDWKRYSDMAVYIHCTTDAIIPSWAYMLVASQLISLEIPFVVGPKNDLIKQLITASISSTDIESIRDARVMIKGCSDIPEPEFAMSELMKRIQPHVKSIMYGEPCSAVPVFKRK